MITPTEPFGKDDYKNVAVLANDYPAYDLADHLADVMDETLPDGRSIWTLDGWSLALLAHNNYPGGAEELQFTLMGLER